MGIFYPDKLCAPHGLVWGSDTQDGCFQFLVCCFSLAVSLGVETRGEAHKGAKTWAEHLPHSRCKLRFLVRGDAQGDPMKVENMVHWELRDWWELRRFRRIKVRTRVNRRGDSSDETERTKLLQIEVILQSINLGIMLLNQGWPRTKSVFGVLKRYSTVWSEWLPERERYWFGAMSDFSGTFSSHFLQNQRNSSLKVICVSKCYCPSRDTWLPTSLVSQVIYLQKQIKKWIN